MKFRYLGKSIIEDAGVEFRGFRFDGFSDKEISADPIARFDTDYYRGLDNCARCFTRMADHGMIMNNGERDGVRAVCPGSYVLTGPDGRVYMLSESEIDEFFEVIPELHSVEGLDVHRSDG